VKPVERALSEREPLASLLDALAAMTPAPGGGSAAAWGLALSAALLEMACAFTLARDTYTDSHPRARVIDARVRDLRALALTCASEDLSAYAGVIEAMRIPDSDPTRTARIEAALSDAAEPPLATARVAAELADLAAELALTGNPNLLGDAATACLLAEAGCRAAVTLVRINLRDAPDDPRLAETEGLAARAPAARARLTLTDRLAVAYR